MEINIQNYKKYIPLDALVAEIENLLKPVRQRLERDKNDPWDSDIALYKFGNQLIKNINTIELKEVAIWHLQEKEDIYDAVKDWGLYKFACIMKDGTIQMFNGSFDEDYEGHINTHINGVNNDYDNVDDIVKWIEFN